MDMTEQLLTLDEGVRSTKYQDSEGHWTIGKGHNLDNAPPCAAVCALQEAAGLPADDQWLPESIEAQYEYDLTANCSWLWIKPWWPAIGEARQAGLQDMAFNMGPETMQTFTTFLGLMATGYYVLAGQDLAKTKVDQELPKRYGRLIQILETGSVSGILPA